MPVVQEVLKYKGKQYKDCGDAIQAIASKYGMKSVPLFADGIGNIDSDHKRLNVHVSKDDVVIGFSIG